MIGKKIKETILAGSGEGLYQKNKKATYIVGYRYWSVRNQNTLVSPYKNTPWKTNKLDFVCPSGHANISPACGCGLYAFFDRRPASGEIAGIVVGTGKTIIHQNGFKAEHMQLVALIKRSGLSSEIVVNIPGQDNLMLKVENALAKKYGVPLLSEAEAQVYYKKLRGNPKGIYPNVKARRARLIKAWFDWHPIASAFAMVALIMVVVIGGSIGLAHIFSLSSNANSSGSIPTSSADGNLGGNTLVGEQITSIAQLNKPEEISFVVNSASGRADKFLIYITTTGNYDFTKDYNFEKDSTCKIFEVNVLECGSAVQNKFITLMLTPKTLGLHNYSFSFAAITKPSSQSYRLMNPLSNPLQIAFSQDIKA